MARGNHRENIFSDSTDYLYFLTLLDDIQLRFPFILHGYCLMTNHFHMLLETKDDSISIIMKRLIQHYTECWNSKKGICGHLFQGRYKSCLIQNDSYFLQTSRYIHLNPVKAKMVDYAEDYPWSSYKTLIGMDYQKRVDSVKTLSFFKPPRNLEYKKFIEDTSLNRYETKIKKEMSENDLWLPW